MFQYFPIWSFYFFGGFFGGGGGGEEKDSKIFLFDNLFFLFSRPKIQWKIQFFHIFSIVFGERKNSNFWNESHFYCSRIQKFPNIFHFSGRGGWGRERNQKISKINDFLFCFHVLQSNEKSHFSLFFPLRRGGTRIYHWIKVTFYNFEVEFNIFLHYSKKKYIITF